MSEWVTLGLILVWGSALLSCSESATHPETMVMAKGQMSNEANAVFPTNAEVKFDPQSGTVRFLKSSNLSRDLEQSETFRTLQVTGQFEEIVLEYLTVHRALFKLENPRDEFVVDSVNKDDLGFTQLRLKQKIAAIPIWGAEILVQLDRDNHINLVQGHYYPTPKGVNLEPQLTVQAARKLAVAHMDVPDFECQMCPTNLVVFMLPELSPRLAYHVRVTANIVEDWDVIVDAETGDILQKLSRVYSH